MLRTTSSDSSQCKSLFQQQAGGDDDDDDDDDDDIYIRVCACVYANMKFLCTHAFTFVDTGTPPAMHTRAKEDQMPHSSLVVTTIITRETAAGERERERERDPTHYHVSDMVPTLRPLLVLVQRRVNFLLVTRREFLNLFAVNVKLEERHIADLEEPAQLRLLIILSIHPSIHQTLNSDNENINTHTHTFKDIPVAIMSDYVYI